MAKNTKIEWAHHTFNPWEGCTKVSPGCDHCYAAARNNRFFGGGNWGVGAPRRRTSTGNWKLPLKWDREAAGACIHHRVFCASLADWLDGEVPVEWLVDLLDLIRRTPDLDWLLLSKRIGNWRARMEEAHYLAYDDPIDSELFDWIDAWLNGKPPANIWMGATVVNQVEADRDVPKLLRVPARVRFLSIEPMLAAIRLDPAWMDTGNPPLYSKRTARDRNGWIGGINWVICGGESGPNARPAHPEWVRSLRDQCAAASVSFFFKQWGEWAPAEIAAGGDLGGDLRRGIVRHLHAAGNPEGYFRRGDAYVRRVGKHEAGRLLDGRTWDQVPEGIL